MLQGVVPLAAVQISSPQRHLQQHPELLLPVLHRMQQLDKQQRQRQQRPQSQRQQRLDADPSKRDVLEHVRHTAFSQLPGHVRTVLQQQVQQQLLLKGLKPEDLKWTAQVCTGQHVLVVCYVLPWPWLWGFCCCLLWQ